MRFFIALISVAACTGGEPGAIGQTSLEVSFDGAPPRTIVGQAVATSSSDRLLVQLKSSDVTVLWSLEWPDVKSSYSISPQEVAGLLWASRTGEQPRLATEGIVNVERPGDMLVFTIDNARKSADSGTGSLVISGTLTAKAP